MSQFAGNMIELSDHVGQPLIVMSSSAYHSLHDPQRIQLERYGQIIHVPIPTIENYGGGSVRCMIAEVF